MHKQLSRLAVCGVLVIPLALTAACSETSQQDRAVLEGLVARTTKAMEDAARAAVQYNAMQKSLEASTAEAKAEAARAADVATEALMFARAADKSAAALSEAEPAVEVPVLLGSKDGALEFQTSTLMFDTGKLYMLVLENPSNVTHGFSAIGFARAVWTDKLLMNGGEFTGPIHEFTVPPGGKVEWSFVPVQPGTYDLECSVPGHVEAGMKGSVLIRR